MIHNNSTAQERPEHRACRTRTPEEETAVRVATERRAAQHRTIYTVVAGALFRTAIDPCCGDGKTYVTRVRTTDEDHAAARVATAS